MSSLTCKQFVDELNDYLDEAVGPEMHRKMEEHANQCRHCYVVVDTTRKTIRVFKGQEAQPIPEDMHARLMAALQKKMAAKQA